MKRHLAREMAGHHDHARYPKENDVKASDQYRRWQEVLELWGFFRPAQRTKGH